MSLPNEIKQKIEQRLAELKAEEAQLSKMLAMLPGANTRSTFTAKPEMRLTDALQKVLSDKPLALKDIFMRLQDLGMSFKCQNPKMTVYSSLSRNPKRFKKTSDGWVSKS